jgi:hypothetical protein
MKGGRWAAFTLFFAADNVGWQGCRESCRLKVSASSQMDHGHGLLAIPAD